LKKWFRPIYESLRINAVDISTITSYVRTKGVYLIPTDARNTKQQSMHCNRPDIHVTRILAKSFLNLDLYKKHSQMVESGRRS